MIEVLLVLLVLLWLTGNLHLTGVAIPDLTLFVINGRPITLVTALIFVLIAWALGLLPSPFREVAAVLFVLWCLSVLGILAFAGLSNLLVIAIIIGIVASIVRK